VVVAGGVAVAKIGPRNVIGMIRYDQRRDGDLKVGDRAPAAMLVALDGKSRQPLLEAGKPAVLIFGSFT
ncbi:MAG TPA: deiodinase-related protein, partial [Thermoanaerobaculia bacterium]|nr:deiodinase-related protein [Thermoanaerobaculia bacterium]